MKLSSWASRTDETGKPENAPPPSIAAQEETPPQSTDPVTSGSIPIRFSRSRTAKINVFFAYASTALTVIHGLGLVPFYVDRIGLALYGGWLAVSNLLAWIELADPGISLVMQQKLAFFFGKHQFADLRRTLSAGITVSFLLALPPMLAFPAAEAICSTLSTSSADTQLLTQSFRLALVNTSLTLIGYGITSANTGLQLAIATGASSIAGQFSGIILTVALLYFDAGLIALPAGMLARTVITILLNSAALILWHHRHLGAPAKPDCASILGLLVPSAYTFLGKLGSALLHRVDAFLAAIVISPTAAGILVLTCRSFDFLKLLPDRFAASVAPTLSHLAGESPARVPEVARRVSSLSALSVALVAGVGVAANGAFVSAWVGTEKYGGATITIAAGLYAVASALAVTSWHLCFSLGAIREMALFGLVEGALKLLLQFALVPLFGLVGFPGAAALASVAISGTYLPRVLSRLLRKERSQLSSDYRRHFLIGAAAVAGGATLSFLFAPLSIAEGTWLRFLCLSSMAFAIIASALFLFNLDFRSEARSFAQKFFARMG